MEYLPIVSIAISIIGLLITYFGFVQKGIERQAILENRLTKLETNNEVFWKVIEPHMAGIIHSPNHRERDELVDKLVKGALTENESVKLIFLLEENIRENHDGGKVLASALLLARVKGLYAVKE
jgi:hypothetical protein